MQVHPKGLAPRWFSCRVILPSVNGNVLQLKAAFGRAMNSPACIVCLFRCWFASPRFWSTDLAVTASDDRGIGEIAPRTPEDAAVTGEPEERGEASAVPRPGDC